MKRNSRHGLIKFNRLREENNDQRTTNPRFGVRMVRASFFTTILDYTIYICMTCLRRRLEPVANLRWL